MPLFHPDSDGEVDELNESQANFFGDSDDDMEVADAPKPPPPPAKKRVLEDQDDEIEEISADNWTVRSNAPSSTTSGRSSPEQFEELGPDEFDEIEQPAAKRPRLSSPPSSPKSASSATPLPTKPKYLGETIIADAWTTTGGKGLIATGDPVKIHLELADEPRKTAKSSSKPVKGQMKLTSMMKKEPAKPAKKSGKPSGTIVRFSNLKGQEVGRLPSKTSAWVARLLETEAVDIQGVVVDCPAKIQTGNTVMLSLRFYFRRSAFIKPSASMMYSSARSKEFDLMQEGAETIQEQTLSERKKSLQGLFESLSLRPRKKKVVSDVDSALAFTKGKKPLAENSKGKAKEVIGEGEEAEEVELEGEELTGNQLSVIYKKAQKHDQEMAGLNPAPSFSLTLRPYQRQALNWMSSLENGTQDAREAGSMHPLWEEYIFPPEPCEGVIDLCEDDQPFYFNPYSGELSLEFPRAERNCRGGVLADVGMGKSIMMSSLIHTNPAPKTLAGEEESKPLKKRQMALNFGSSSRSSPRKPKATLIVAPLSLLSQWKAELDRSSKKGTLATVIYHGTARADLNALMEGDDDEQSVCITSYGTLSSEHAKTLRGGSSSFYEVEWLRVVLDEAHYIKSRHTKTAKACYALQARRRWALTGTPIVNRLEDLHSLLHFLRDEPWSDFAFFKSSVTTPFLKQDPQCLDVVQIILESILLRREKNMKDSNGKPIVSLPPKEIVVEKLEFSPNERKIYDSIYADAKHAYDSFSAKGVVGKNMSNILALLMRLRRAVLHPSLIRQRRATTVDSDGDEIIETDSSGIDINAMIAQYTNGEDEEEDNNDRKFAVDVLKDLKSIETQECPLCLDTVQDPVLLPECHHAGCKECIVAHLQDQEEKGNEGFCPVCQRRPVTERSLIEVTVRKRRTDTSAIPTSSPSIILRTNDFVSSTKLDALAKHLRRLREKEPSFRAIVFSQFTGFLDVVQTILKREGFEEYRLDGQLSQKQRTQVLQDFAEPSNSPKIFAISLKAGGVGLNLTQANYVFMMDSWWNSAVEDQAIDRVHRIGQDKTVYVTHFVISRTIEERILAIQKRKTAIVKGALGGKGKSDQETFENLKMMFSS